MTGTFRDLMAEIFDMLVIGGSTYVVHATTDDGVVHLAELTIRTKSIFNDLALFLPCRRLVIDGQVDEFAHLLRRPDDPVDCMTCLVRGLAR